MRSWVSPLHCVIFKEYDQFRSHWLSVHCLLVLETCSIVDPIQKNAQKEISPKAIQSVGSHLSFHIRHSSRNIAKYSHKRQTGWALSKLLNKINQFQLSCNFISSNLLSGRSIFLFNFHAIYVLCSYSHHNVRRTSTASSLVESTISSSSRLPLFFFLDSWEFHSTILFV